MEAPVGSACPICRRELKPRAQNASFPFCSPQCKLVDLGRWLDGAYRVPGPPVESSTDLDGADPRGSRGEQPDPHLDEE
jgi:endogenous inhibitor of DNA gyrase (YacG/DUF329 family)